MSEVRHVRAGLRRYKPGDHLVVAWWDKEWFETMLETALTDDEWAAILDAADTVLEYAQLGDQLTDAAENALCEMRKQATGEVAS